MKHSLFPLTLTHYEDIAPNTRHLTFLSNAPIEFLPGQFITLHWEKEEKKIHRNYSLANYGGYNPTDPTRLELAASYVPNGFASEQLFSMREGDQVQASGPFGRLILTNEPTNRYLLIATGTGITPYRTMLFELEKRMQHNPHLRILLLFGVRCLDDLLYKNDLFSFEEKHSQLSMKIYYSRESYPPTPYGQLGYVTQELHNITINPDTDMVYLCGNPNMVDNARQILSDKGLPTSRIRQERYISPKRSS